MRFKLKYDSELEFLYFGVTAIQEQVKYAPNRTVERIFEIQRELFQGIVAYFGKEELIEAPSAILIEAIFEELDIHGIQFLTRNSYLRQLPNKKRKKEAKRILLENLEEESVMLSSPLEPDVAYAITESTLISMRELLTSIDEHFYIDWIDD